MSVLLVDGDNLLTIGFHGVKNYFYKGIHIGGIYHFLNTLRRTFEIYQLDKIVVFWDGEDGSQSRREIYGHYKMNRKQRIKTEEELSSYHYQRERIKQYLEEVYVRQGQYQYCETDDAIAYYTQHSPSEYKIVYSSDGDLTQLVSDRTKIYNPSHGKLYSPNDIVLYDHQEVLIENIKLIKMICGDPSDNIAGIRNMGIKRILKLFPELKTTPLTLEDIIEKGKRLFDEEDTNLLKNLTEGITKFGPMGDDFFVLNKKIVSLDEPFLTDEAIENIELLINGNLDPEGRSYKNTMKMMMEDGIFNLLPKSDDAWIKFLTPFLRLTRKEKNNNNNNNNKNRPIKIENYE